MAIVREAVGTALSNTGGTTSSVIANKPAGVTNGDVLVVVMAWNSTATVTATPAGWVQIFLAASGGTLAAYYKVITSAGTEPTTYTWTISAAAQWSTKAARYSGVDNTTPLDVTAATSTATTNSTTGATPTITTVTAGAVVNSTVRPSNVNTPTPPGTITRWFDSFGEGVADLVGNGAPVDSGDMTKVTAGSTGTFSWSDVTKGAWLLATWALRPAAGAAAVIPDLTMAPMTH